MNDDSMRDHQGNVMALPEEARQQVVSYLKHQAGKSLTDLLTLVDRAASLTEQSVAGITDAQARVRPSENEWSINEILGHVNASLRGTARLIEGLGRGTELSSTFGSPPVLEDEGRSLVDLSRDVGAAYEDIRSVIRALEDGAALEGTARHPFFGDLNWKEWTAFVYVHARDHAGQVEQVKSAPGFPVDAL